jgi:hypothetical protein
MAYSPSTNSTGDSWNYSSQAAADTGALGSCARGDCEILGTFSYTCGAIAVGSTGGAATGAGSTLDTAQAFALAAAVNIQCDGFVRRPVY